jgi:hypothetical protein
MDLVTKEIENALRVLSIPSESFRLLPDDQGAVLYQELLAEFVAGTDRRWWWEAFLKPSSSKTFEDGTGFEKITELVPKPNAMVWFVVEEDQLPFYPIYEATPAAIQQVIGECYGFEYYIIPKSKDWLLCENHHNRMIGVGNQITARLEACNA